MRLVQASSPRDGNEGDNSRTLGRAAAAASIHGRATSSGVEIPLSAVSRRACIFRRRGNDRADGGTGGGGSDHDGRGSRGSHGGHRGNNKGGHVAGVVKLVCLAWSFTVGGT